MNREEAANACTALISQVPHTVASIVQCEEHKNYLKALSIR